jgi:hypothetical protein
MIRQCGAISVRNSACSNVGHRSRRGQSPRLTALESTEQESGLSPSIWAEVRRLHLSTQPDERLVVGTHRIREYVTSDIQSSAA